MKTLYTIFIILTTFIAFHVAPPVKREEKQKQEEVFKTEGLDKEQSQDQEYFRYLTQVVGELEKDPEFKDKLNNATEEDIKSGKIADHLDLIGHNVRKKLDEVKRMEVEYQRDLLRQEKHHMSGIDRNYWNPIHHDNQDTFEKDDLKKLLSKHNDMMSEQDKKRHEEFKSYEIKKEHTRREGLKNMTDGERKVEEEKHKEVEDKAKKHTKVHEPGHKEQLEEVWEKEDGLDPDSFDPKTFFNLHDKNSDGYLDVFELETLFLQDLDKVYNESDPETDTKERAEEMERMREHVMKSMDHDKDGLLSVDEFMAETKTEDFEKDEDWKTIADEDQYTEEELNEYERMLDKDNDQEPKGEDHHGDDEIPPPNEGLPPIPNAEEKESDTPKDVEANPAPSK